MAHKKRNPTARSKPSPPAAPPSSPPDAAQADSPEVDTCNAASDQLAIQSRDGGDSSPSYAAIKLECERALTALRRGNRARALKLMKECCSRHESSGFAYRVHGTLCVKVAATLDDPGAKQRHLRTALESARRAAELSPSSIEFANFYANLMFELATEAKDFEEVAKECARALAVECPVDPAKESLQEEGQQAIATAEARVAHVQGELRQLVQKANIASLSCWMKTLSNGEEKFRLIPIRSTRPGEEDPIEVRLVQGRRPNEVKKSTKTPEERRKEIEVRVAAARLMQQKAESTQAQGEGGRDERALDSPNLGFGHRRRNGHMRKNGSNLERKGWIRSYWDAMSVDMKKDLLRVRVCDLKSHFGSLKDTLPKEVLSEALSYGEASRTWKFWLCCRCGQKFSNPELHGQHTVQEHMGNLNPEMKRLLPRNADSEWVDMILNCAWKPVDVMAAVEMLERKARFKDFPFTEDSYVDHHTWECIDPFQEASDSYLGNRSLRNNNTNTNNNNNNNSLNNCTAEISSLVDSWPISDDPERMRLLGKIRAVFEMLIRHKYLAASHLNKVMQITMDAIQSLACGSELLNHGVDRTPMCICFLGAAHLKKVLQFLQELSHACGLGRYTEKLSGLMDDLHNIRQGPEIKEKIVFNGDASCLLLDEFLLPTQITPGPAQGAVWDDATAPIPPVDVSYNTEALLSWIFSGSPSGDQLASWMRTIEDRRQQGMDIVKMLDKEFSNLQGLCEKKCERISYEEALRAVEDLYVEESKKRENIDEFVQRSFESVLRKRREELIESENGVTYVTNRFELDAISNVLLEAEAMNANQFGYEENYAGMTSQLCDLESGEEDEWRMKDHLRQMDGCMEIAIQKVKEHSFVELRKIDAQILRSVGEMQQMELKLGPISAYDYRAILLPLVKSYLRAHLENLAEKDATEKSDAAREAFLAELAVDAKKIIKGGSENTRHLEKTKDKKKNKDHRKTRDLKATNGHEDLLLQAPVSDSNSVSPDSNNQDSEFVVPMNSDDLDQQEEEFRRIIELEEDEKKLEETLEFQRRIENEAKQKHLAKQQIKSFGTYLEKAEDEPQDAQLKVVADGPDVHEHIRPPMQEKLAKENGYPSNIITTTNGSMGSIQSSADLAAENVHDMHHSETKQDLVNGVVTENGLHLPDRRAGKRHKRRKNPSRLVDGKFESVALEKENLGVTQADNHFREQIIVLKNQDATNEWGDDGSKLKLQVEDEQEERFQADLKHAVRQSLDTYQAHSKGPLDSSLRMTLRAQVDRGYPFREDTTENVNGTALIGTGLKNEVGEYNCFLNVIIQSLWHLRRFREEFLGRSRSEHDHVGNPCVVCALYDIFTAMDVATKDSNGEAVAPTPLRIALSNLYPDSNFFQEAQMNDASEVLAVTFDCLHRSFSRGSSVSDMESVERNSSGSWDCANSTCIVHSLFGMDIFEGMHCYHCGLESRRLKYTSFFHNINANAFRTMKATCAESSFDKLLSLVEMNHQLSCDPEVGGCGKPNYIHHFLSTPPNVFMIVLGWQNTCESADDIKATVAAMSTMIDISVLYRGLDPGSTYSLVSMVCYYGQHYHCFAYSHDHEKWIMYDDKTVKVIGGWADVLSVCERGHLQPQVLFFEAVN